MTTKALIGSPLKSAMLPDHLLFSEPGGRNVSGEGGGRVAPWVMRIRCPIGLEQMCGAWQVGQNTSKGNLSRFFIRCDLLPVTAAFVHDGHTKALCHLHFRGNVYYVYLASCDESEISDDKSRNTELVGKERKSHLPFTRKD